MSPRHRMSMTPLKHNKTASLVSVYCVAIWCMSDISSTQASRAMSVVLFSVLTLKMCSKPNMKPEFLQSQHQQMNWYFATYCWTICPWATRETEQRSDDLFETWEELAPIPASSASPHFRKCVVQPSLRPVIANPWCRWELSPTSLLFRERRTGTLHQHWERDACCVHWNANIFADPADFVASCCQTSQTSVPRMWETCCNHGRAIFPIGPRCYALWNFLSTQYTVNVRTSMRPCLAIPPVSMTTVEVRSGEGFSHEQQLNNSGFVSVRVEKLKCFKHALVVSDVTPSVAHLRLCTSAPTLFASVSVLVVLGCSVSPCRSQWDFDGHVVFVPTTVLNESHSFFVLSQDWLVVYTCFGSSIELQRETCCSKPLDSI